MWNIYKLTKAALTDRATSMQWCQNKGLLPSNKLCPQCRNLMTLECEHGLGRFRCQKSSKHRNKSEINIPLADKT